MLATTTYYYDGLNRLTETVDALGYTSTSAYDHNGNLTGTTDNDGHVTTYQYDALNRLTVTINATGSSTYNYYDLDSNLTGVLDTSSHLTSYLDNADGRLTETEDYDSKSPSPITIRRATSPSRWTFTATRQRTCTTPTTR